MYTLSEIWSLNCPCNNKFNKKVSFSNTKTVQIQQECRMHALLPLQFIRNIRAMRIPTHRYVSWDIFAQGTWACKSLTSKQNLCFRTEATRAHFVFIASLRYRTRMLLTLLGRHLKVVLVLLTLLGNSPQGSCVTGFAGEFTSGLCLCYWLCWRRYLEVVFVLLTLKWKTPQECVCATDFVGEDTSRLCLCYWLCWWRHLKVVFVILTLLEKTPQGCVCATDIAGEVASRLCLCYWLCWERHFMVVFVLLTLLGKMSQGCVCDNDSSRLCLCLWLCW